MKNDSPMFPFKTPTDKFFDSNKDGKLTGTETIFRDASLMEMSYNAQSDKNKSTKPANQSASKNTSGKITAFCIVVLIAVLLYFVNEVVATLFLIIGVIVVSKIFKK